MKLLQPLCLLVVENPPTLAVHSDNDIILLTAGPVTWRWFFHDHRHHRDVLLHLSAMPVHNQTWHFHSGIKHFDSPDDLRVWYWQSLTCVLAGPGWCQYLIPRLHKQAQSQSAQETLHQHPWAHPLMSGTFLRWWCELSLARSVDTTSTSCQTKTQVKNLLVTSVCALAVKLCLYQWNWQQVFLYFTGHPATENKSFLHPGGREELQGVVDHGNVTQWKQSLWAMTM